MEKAEIYDSDKAYVVYIVIIKLPRWGQNKMVDISQTTISNAFSSMKLLYYDLNFTEISLQGSDWQ